MARCKGKNRTANQCSRLATATGFCDQHDPEKMKIRKSHYEKRQQKKKELMRKSPMDQLVIRYNELLKVNKDLRKQLAERS